MGEIIHAGNSVAARHAVKVKAATQTAVLSNLICATRRRVQSLVWPRLLCSPTLKALRPRFIIGLFTSRIVVLHREVFSAGRLRIPGQTIHVPQVALLNVQTTRVQCRNAAAEVHDKAQILISSSIVRWTG